MHPAQQRGKQSSEYLAQTRKGRKEIKISGLGVLARANPVLDS